jgi:hypothetical protein
MRPETPRSLVAALALAAACAGDPPATALTAAATTGSSSGTSDTGAGEPTTGAAASTSDGGGTSTSGASSTSTGTSTSTSTGTSTGSGSTAVVPADSCAGGCGYLRIWRFSPQHDQLKVETYSPSLNKSMTGPEEQFTLTVDLSAATGVFALAGATSGPGAQLALPVDGLKSGATYEWYAVVKECGARVTTPKRSFTVE